MPIRFRSVVAARQIFSLQVGVRFSTEVLFIERIIMLVLTVDRTNQIMIVNRETKEVLGYLLLSDGQNNNVTKARIAFNFQPKYSIVRDNCVNMNEKGRSGTKNEA
jgi:hypothetical protein